MVALDGSEKELRALSVAVALADIADADVHLVRVVRPVSQRTLAQAELLGVDAASVSDRPAVEREVAETALRLSADTEHPITWAVLEGSDVADALIQHATVRGSRAVVMGTRAASSVGLVLVGSVADRVMRECPRPVVLVPPGAAYMQGKRIHFRRILVPFDGSALAERCVDFLLSLPRASELELVLIEAARAADTIANAERQLRVVAERVRARGAAAEVRVTKSDNPVKALAAAVREFLVEMIAMSTRGEGGLERLVVGSVAQGVVRIAEVPVLVLTPAMLAAVGS